MSSRSPRILLVHGAWHGAWSWEKNFVPWLRERGYDAETLDLPGHGQPGAQRIPWHSVREYTDAVAAAVARRPGPVVVAGHSMGGFVVQKLMERRPPQLAGVALFAAAPPWGVLGVILHLLRTRPGDLLWSIGALNLYHLVRTPAFAHAMFYGAGHAARAVEGYWRQMQNESFRAFLDMLVLDLPKPARTDPRLPKWIVGGERDAIFPPEVVRRTARAYGTTAGIYPGMAHNLMLEPGWETLARDFSSWLDTVTAGPATERAGS